MKNKCIPSFLGLLLLVFFSAAHALDEDELLLPEQAFKLSSQATAGGAAVRWSIADGYYLYRSKFRFESLTDGVQVGEVEYPSGKMKEDQFFGPMEIYRGKVGIRVPLQVTKQAGKATIKVTSQGCADVGICYPPQYEEISVDLAAAPVVTANPMDALADLGRSLGGDMEGADEFLPPDEAFRFSSEALENGQVRLRWDIAEGYYLYRDKFKIQAEEGTQAEIGVPVFPPAKIKEDPLFGTVEAYYNRVDILVPVTSETGNASLQVGYQGCAEKGICYPPIKKSTKLAVLTAAAVPSLVAGTVAADTAGMQDNEPVSEQDKLAALLAGDSIWLMIATFFGLGLLLTFTPCVFPMIPILSGIIVGQGKDITTHKAFVLSLTYVLAMSVTYTIAGYLAGISGESLQVALQTPWVLVVFAGVFVLLSLSMFGFYDLQLPSSLQTKLTQISHKQEGGTLLGVAIMGFLSALIVGPCLAPPLAGALIYISQEGSGPLGAMALFALSMGMGAPLVLMGTLEGKFLPRAGAWMNAVKGVFGVLLLAVAIYLLDSVLPTAAIMLLWAALFIVSSVYLGALDTMGTGVSGFQRLWKGLGLVLLVYGTLLLIGGAAGNNSLFQPLGKLGLSGAAGQAVESAHDLFQPVKGEDGLQFALAESSAQGRPAMLDFYADWCVACKELERFTFSDGRVQQAMAQFSLLQTDVTANDDRDKALMKSLGVIGPPSILFYDGNGQELRKFRLVGYLPAAEFMAHLDKVIEAVQ